MTTIQKTTKTKTKTRTRKKMMMMMTLVFAPEQSDWPQQEAALPATRATAPSELPVQSK